MGINSKRQQEIDYYLSKSNLEKYLKEYSANYIATKLFYPDFTTTAGTVIDKAKSYGIKTHSISSSTYLQSVKNAKEKTNIKKYGCINPSQNESIKKKKENKAIQKYGHKNVFQSEEIKIKSRETCIKKYGVEYVGRSNLFQKKNARRSKFHQSVEKILNKNDIQFESEVYAKFLAYNEYYKKNYSPIVDILIEEYKIVIECNGDYWHANPKLYKPDDIFNTWKGQKKSSEIWGRDNLRAKQIENFGYKVITVWESDYRGNKQKFESDLINAIKNKKNN